MDIWTEFLNRFGNIKVRELYAATEGNIGFINYTSKVGTVGRVNFVHRVSRGVALESGGFILISSRIFLFPFGEIMADFT